MKLGLFLMPNHPPERSLYDATQWDLEMIRLADELGYTEAWIGEHHTVEWEPIPAPDLLIAQAIAQTKQIKLAAGSHILPYHHPVELAHRIAYLDHLAQGRLMIGIGSGSVPTDLALFNVDAASGEARKKTAEALEIMTKLWTTKEPFEYKGQYWTVVQGEKGKLHGPHLFPYQKPHPPIGVSGNSRGSGTIRLAGEYGFIPMSFGFNNDIVVSHWDALLEGAKKSGKTPDRREWRITKDILVAATDKEAYEGAVQLMMGRFYREYFLPLFGELGALAIFKQQPDVPDAEVTAEYMAKNAWLIGSPETVANKLDALYEKVGGFGTLLMTGYDYADSPDIWRRSMRLMAEEVIPRMRHA